MILFFVSAALAVLIIGGAYICYRLAFAVPRSQKNRLLELPDNEQYAPYRESAAALMKSVTEIPFEEVSVLSHDGLTLYGKYYETAPGAPLQIMFHGYRSSAERDFCGGLPEALKLGFNVLLPDQRAHGKSGGRALSFGINESRDCLAWVNYALKRFGEDTKILFYGMSMGASTVLMATALPLPENVKGIVADCGYSSPAAIIKKVVTERHYPVVPTYALIRLGGKLFGGFDIEKHSAVKALKNCDIPVLFIHGEDDRFVPCDMGRENYAACRSDKKKLLTVPCAGHGISYMADKEAYLKALNEFLSSVSD